MAPAPVHVMAKPRGAVCNLDCSYCYYLAKEQLYGGDDPVMSDEVLEAFTRQYLEANPAVEVTFAWQGGEPTLLGVGFFERAVQLQARHRRPKQRVVNSLQTNGLLLDDEWGSFLAEHDFLVGISVDGPDRCHDAYRRNKGGGATLGRVLGGVAALRRHGVRYNALTCVHRSNVARPLDVYRFLRDEVGATFIQFIPIVTRDDPLRAQIGGRLIGESLRGREYGDFLIAIFDEWARRDIGRVYVQTFDTALANWSGHSHGLCVFEETCGRSMVLEYNGDLFACDHFVEPRYRMGNLLEQPLTELMQAPAQAKFGRDKRDLLPARCIACRYRFACHGGCPKNRLAVSPGDDPPLNHLCESYLAFFEYIDGPMQYMARELGAGRPPASLMERLAEQDRARAAATAGRNDPCPCGSGKKFKRCHGRA